MKNCVAILLIVVSSVAYAENNTGDTIGTARTILSSMSSAIERIKAPEKTIGVDEAKSKTRVLKMVCAELGTTVGQAFAVQSAVKFYTPSMRNSPYSKVISEKINQLIDVLTDVNNDVCLGYSDDVLRVVAVTNKADAIASELSSMLAILEKQN